MQDENTGLWLDPDNRVMRIPRPPLAILREEQLRLYGHWTAGREG
jgi:hypothetical protein